MQFPSGYVDGNTNPASTPDNDVGPGWGWAALLAALPRTEQRLQPDQFQRGRGTGANAPISQQPLTIFQCPSDPLPADASPSTTATSATPSPRWRTATTSAATAGWNALPTPAGTQPSSDGGAAEDGDVGVTARAGDGLFYRNSHNRIANVTDGLSNTIIVGERLRQPFPHAPGPAP